MSSPSRPASVAITISVAVRRISVAVRRRRSRPRMGRLRHAAGTMGRTSSVHRFHVGLISWGSASSRRWPCAAMTRPSRTAMVPGGAGREASRPTARATSFCWEVFSVRYTRMDRTPGRRGVGHSSMGGGGAGAGRGNGAGGEPGGRGGSVCMMGMSRASLAKREIGCGVAPSAPSCAALAAKVR